jgi:conjugative transfer signal peptidase TraF
VAGVLVVALLALSGALAAGLRINGTHSFPVGLYLASRKPPEKGDLVFVDPPALPLFALAKDRGYLGAGYSAAGCGYLIKRLVGVTGDRVTIDSAGVEVNGIRLANSAPCDCDGASRPLQPYALKDHNPTTGNRHRGVNILALMATDYSDPRWMTYRQAQSQGWQVSGEGSARRKSSTGFGKKSGCESDRMGSRSWMHNESW